MSDEATPAQTEPLKDWGALASKHFGKKYTGEATEAAETQTLVDEVPDDVPDDAQQSLDELPDDTDADSLEEPLNGEEAFDAVDSFEDFIAQQELDAEWAHSLKIPVKINGEQSHVSIDDMVRSYQTQEAANRRLEDAKAQSQEMRSQMEQERQALTQQVNVAVSLITQAEQSLGADEAKIDWQSLRESDPAEFSARKEEFRERHAAIEAMKRTAAQEYMAAKEKHEADQKQKRQQLIASEVDTLLKKVPEWASPSSNAEKQQATDYLKTIGYTEAEIEDLTDHRLLIMARDASRVSKSSDVKRKRIMKAPKAAKPGGGAQMTAQRKISEAQKALKKSGTKEAALAYMRAKRNSA
jgi:hypothetical protein